MTVKVTTLNKWHESKVEFDNADGKPLLTDDFSSPDMNHGLVADSCSWSPDSKFFVYSMYSSGGHEAWSFPTMIYVRSANRTFELDDVLGSITDPDFTIAPPSILHTHGRIRPGSIAHVIKMTVADAPDAEFTVDLNELAQQVQTLKSK